jgi:hypothetical protein
VNPLRVAVLAVLLCSPALLQAANGSLSASALVLRLGIGCLIATAAELLLTGLVPPAPPAPVEQPAPGADDTPRRRRADTPG